ncbi:MAG: hypothetical protein RR032_06075, partial [Oscillospiraceae bacterium]
SYSLIGCGRNMGEEIALPSNTGTASEISSEAPSLMGQSIPLPEGMRSVTAQAYASGTHYIAGFGEDKLLFAKLQKDGTSQKFELPGGCQFVYSICPYEGNLAVLCGSLPTIFTDGQGLTHFNEAVEGKLSLLIYSTEGELLSQTPLEQLYDNPSMIFKLMLEKNGEFIIQCQDALVKISADGKELARLTADDPNNWFTSICFYKDSLLAVSSERLSENSQLSIIDLSEFKITDTIDIGGQRVLGLGQGEANTVLAATTDGLYSLNMENYSLESIVSYNQLYMQEEFIGVQKTADGYLFYSRYTDCIYTAEYKENIPERKLIRLATDVDGGCATSLANAFNRSQQDYYVSVESYGEGSAGSLENLKTDIATGNSPHMFAFAFSESLNEVDSSKIYLDLAPYLNDMEIELAYGLYEAMSVNQKLYCLPYTFSVITMTAPESLVSSSGLSADEVVHILNAQPAGFSMLPSWVTKDLLFDRAANYALDSYINWENMSCNFNSQGFRELLEFCHRWAGDGGDTSQNNTNLFELETLQGLFRLAGISDYTKGNYYFVGLPAQEGNGSMFYPELRLYASSQFAPSEGVLEFLRFAMSEEGAKANTGPGFFGSKLSFNSALEKAQNDGITMFDTNYVLNERDTAKLTELVAGTNAAYGKDAQIIGIMTEEASYYFAGQKSLDETVEIIQSRVSLYLAEKS